ncbi:hypothetical protein ACFX2B_008947 [Malus domestica]
MKDSLAATGTKSQRSKNLQSMDELDSYDLNDALQNTDQQATKPKRPKRRVNEKSSSGILPHLVWFQSKPNIHHGISLDLMVSKQNQTWEKGLNQKVLFMILDNIIM